MSALEWKQVADISERSISLKNVDALCDLLQEARVDSLTERRQLIHVFNITQVLLNIRSEQWKNAEEILIQKTSELRNLQLENDDLEKENHELQRALSVSNTAREFVDEKLKLSTENERIRKEFDIMKFNMDQLTHEKTVLNTEKSELQKKVSEMHEEIQSLTSKCEYMHSKLQENPNVRELSEVKFRREISNLRSQVRLQKAEIDTLEEHKHNLECDVSRLEKNLKEATADLEKATDEQLHLRSVMKEKDKCLARKIDECDALKKHLSKKSEDTDSGNDVILDAVDQKILEWKQVISEKDTEIVKLYEQIQNARKQLKKASCDSTKFGIKTLLSTLSERDYQVNILKEQLADATKEVERSTRLLEEFKRQLDSTHGGSDETKAKRIKSLQIQLREKEVLTGRLEKSLRLAEETCQQQQVEITNLEQRLHSFECGEYGLAEALSELRAAKTQLESKDRQLEELCRVASQAETAVNETNVENEYLRERLNIKPDEVIDLKGYRMVKQRKDDEERALNIVLQKEIEKLEDERLRLKRQLRSCAKQLGQRVGTAEFSVDSSELIEPEAEKEVAAAIAFETRVTPVNLGLEKLPDKECDEQISSIWQSRISALNNELVRSTQLVEEGHLKLEEHKVRLTRVTEANKCLQAGLKELQTQLQAFGTQNDEPGSRVRQLECPTLEKLLSALDAGQFGEQLDTDKFLKARVDHLEGANAALRQELREIRLTAATKEHQLQKISEKLRVREAQLKHRRPVQEDIKHSDDPILSDLPGNMSPTSEATIAQLEEHLRQLVMELEEKDSKLDEMGCVMEEYRRKFALCRHKQGLLYRDFYNEREAWEERERNQKAELEKLEQQAAEAVIFKEQLIKLQATLCTPKVEAIESNELCQRKVAEMSRELTILRTNEAGLVRRHLAAKEENKALKEQNLSLKSDIIKLESAVNARLGYYMRYKEVTAYQLESLRRELDRTVSRKKYEQLTQDYELLAVKYHELCNRNVQCGDASVTVSNIQQQLRQMQEYCDSLSNQLASERQERCPYGSATANDWKGEKLQKPSPEPRDPFTLIGEQMVGKIAVLEMKELNERERAKHAQHMLNIMRQTNHQLEERNRELEQAVSRLTESSLSLQSSEHQLRQELADAVPRSVTCAMEKRIEELELANISLRHEMEQLKEIALISVFQTQNIEQQNKAHELEVETLRQQLEELESKDEHSAVVARLHRQVTGLQISESTAVRRLAASEKKAAHLESVILRVEQHLAKREAELREQRNYHDRWRKRYSETINTLRARYAGCVPIAEQERVASRYAEISRERARLQLELETAIQRAIKAEASLQGDRERNELVKHFKLVDDATDFGSSQKKESLERKLIQCQSKLADLRVEETIQRRQAEQLRLHNQHLQLVIHNQESQLNSLESENAQLSKQLERREIEWELRECELEKALYASKAAQQEAVAATDKLGITEEVVTMAHSISETEANPFGDLQANRMPNAELPVSEQLKEALTIIKRNVLTILNQRVEIESLKKKLAELIREMQFNKEDIGLQSLPYQIPEKDYQTPTETDADNPATGSLRLQIDLLQRRLAAKEESLAEAHELLRQVEKANEDMQEKFTKQNADLLSRLRRRIEESVAQLSRSVESTASRQQADQYCKQLNQRLKEMEEALEEQHQVVIRQLDRTKQANRETEMWKMKYEQLGQEAEAARHKITEQYKRLFSQLQLDRENLQAQLNHCNKRVRELSSEVSKWKQEATKSPSAAQRQTTERLKAELADREKRQQALTKALAELRRDLLAQAEHAVLINAPTNKLSYVEGVRAPSMVDKSVEAVVTPAVQSGFPEHVVAVREESDLQQVPSSDIHSLLKQRNEQLEAECNELRGQLTRMKQIRTLRNDSSMNHQLQEMEEKNRDLENQIKRLQSSRERQHTETMRKLEAEVVSLNSQLASKIAELQRAQRQLEETRIALDSALRENELLRGRLSHNWQPAMLPEKEDLDALEKRKASVKPGELKERLALHQQVLELKSEVEMLRRAKPISLDLPVETKPVTGGPVEFEAAELRNRLAQERIKALEQQLIDTGRSTPGRIQMDQAIQQDLLRVTKENMELRSKLETMRADIPRLKMRIQELQSYVERMKHENGTFVTSRRNDKSIESRGNGTYNIKRVGESGKSCKELEKIIVRLKNVLQRSLVENERLKSTPSATVQNENRQLQAENERLRMELEQAKLAADALMTTHRASSEKSIQKLSQEYERLRKSYEEIFAESARAKLEHKEKQQEGTVEKS